MGTNYMDQMFVPRVSGVEIGADGAPRARTDQMGSMRRLLAACAATTVGAGLTQDVQAVVTQAFKLDRMYLNAAMATALMTINNLRVATFSLNVTPNALCADMFLRDAVGTELVGYTAQAGVGFVVNVTNPSGAGVLCNMSFVGWSLIEG